MSYKFKGPKIIINGEEQKIVPGPLPSSPTDGLFTIDENDNKFKVYNESKSRWIILGDAEDIFFDNSSNGFTSTNIQDAIEENSSARFQYLQYQIIGSLNYDNYLYSGSDKVSGLLFSARRSGNSNNGYRYSNCAPQTANFTGTVVSAAASITGLAVSTGSSSSTVTLHLELWKVGFNNEGTKLGDIEFDIESGSYNIGTYWNSSVLTSFSGTQIQDVDVTAGDLLALKFNSQTGSSNIVALQNITITLEIRGSIS